MSQLLRSRRSTAASPTHSCWTVRVTMGLVEAVVWIGTKFEPNRMTILHQSATS